MHHNNVRKAAIIAITKVQLGGSFAQIMPELEINLSSNDKAFFKELCLGSARLFYVLESILNNFLTKQFKQKTFDIKSTLILGLYEIFFTRVPNYATVSEYTKLLNSKSRNWARALVNSILRNAIRNKNEINSCLNDKTFINDLILSPWMRKKIIAQWSHISSQVIDAQFHKAPLTLCVNSSNISRANYVKLLEKNAIEYVLCQHSQDGIIIKSPTNTNGILGFNEGLVNIQDEGAQFCIQCLDLTKANRILDACSAPGGKTCHILSKRPDIHIDALDQSKLRIIKLKDNLKRLKHKANIIHADATQTKTWWDDKKYDIILLDAPCSGSGVMRRRPDINLIRNEAHLLSFCELQATMLRSLWPLLNKGGVMLYITCSIFKEENEQQIKHFISEYQNEALLFPIPIALGKDTNYGRQFFPTIGKNDGFFYSLIQKK